MAYMKKKTDFIEYILYGLITVVAISLIILMFKYTRG